LLSDFTAPQLSSLPRSHCGRGFFFLQLSPCAAFASRVVIYIPLKICYNVDERRFFATMNEIFRKKESNISGGQNND